MEKEFKTFEYHKYTPENESEDLTDEQYKGKLEKRIESFLEHKENKIGEGKSAEVYENPNNKTICYKFLTVDPSKGIIENPTPQVINRVSKEAKILNSVYNLSDGVEVPKPYNDVEASIDGKDGKKKSFQVITMERLNAVSLRDIEEGRAEFPMEFIKQYGVDFIYKFFKKLEDFVELMHEENIYHRDIHSGNIMINLENGKPGIIDFGASTESAFSNASDEDIYVEKHPNIKDDVIMVKDENGLQSTKKSFLGFIGPEIKKLTKVA